MDIIEFFNERLSLRESHATENWYQCPICNSGTVKLNKINGKYKNWNCNCDTKRITRLVFKGSGYTKKEVLQEIPLLIKEVPNKIDVELSLIDSPILLHNLLFFQDLEDLYSNPLARITYPYSPTQQTLRVHFIDDKGNKRKKVFPQVLTDRGWVSGRGNDIFPLYTGWRILKGELIVVVEGEKCVDYLQSLEIESVNVLNSYTTSIENVKLAIEESTELIPNLTQFLYIPDLDVVGMKKSIVFQKASWSIGIPCKIFDIRSKLLKSLDFKKGYDIADYISENRDVNLVSILENEFRKHSD